MESLNRAVPTKTHPIYESRYFELFTTSVKLLGSSELRIRHLAAELRRARLGSIARVQRIPPHKVLRRYKRSSRDTERLQGLGQLISHYKGWRVSSMRSSCFGGVDMFLVVLESHFGQSSGLVLIVTLCFLCG